MKNLLSSIAIALSVFSCIGPVSPRVEMPIYDDLSLKDSISGYSFHTPSYIRRTRQFKKYSVKGKIVWVGDSITQELELNELFGRTDIVNRGIGMDIIQGVKERLPDYLKDGPKQVVLMIGTNNMRYFSGTNPHQIFLELQNLANQVSVHNIPVVVVCPLKHGTLDSQPGINSNEKIDTLNNLLSANHAGFDYVNLNERLAPKGYLIDSLTNDGIHLLPAGISIVRDIIKPFLRQ